MLAALAFVAVYAAAIALSVPGGAVLTIAGGFMFGSILGTAAGGGRGDARRDARVPDRQDRARRPAARPGRAVPQAHGGGLPGERANYLLVLRLIPLFPFWIVNLVPAFLGVPLRTYVLGTFIGIIPGSFVFASVGAGLGSVLDSGQEFAPSSVLTPQIVIALVGLALLALLPVGYRKWKRRAPERPEPARRAGTFRSTRPRPGRRSERRLKAAGFSRAAADFRIYTAKDGF